MSKNTKNSKSETPAKRGRKPFKFNLPRAKTFTVNDLRKLNPQFKCRLSLYNHRDKLIASKVIELTGDKLPTGGVGAGLDVYRLAKGYVRSQAAKKSAKTRKVTPKSEAPVATPTVDLTPAPAPVAETPVAEPVTETATVS